LFVVLLKRITKTSVTCNVKVLWLGPKNAGGLNRYVWHLQYKGTCTRWLLTCYTKYDIYYLIIFSVVATLSCSTLIINSLIISVTHKCVVTFPTATSFLLLSLLNFPHILTNPKIMHVTSRYYHSWYLVFEFTFNVTYFHRLSDFWCMRSYLAYETLNIIFSVVDATIPLTLSCFCKLLESVHHLVKFSQEKDIFM